MSPPPTVRVTLAGVRSATHLLHAGGYLRHLLATTTGSVVVDYLGSGTFLGRDPVSNEHVHSLLPRDDRLQAKHDLRRGDDRVDALPGTPAMRRPTGHHDAEAV